MAKALARVEELLSLLPGDLAKDMRARVARLRGLLFEQRPPAFLLVGRRGAGKSSLVNALFGEKVADVGHVKAETPSGKWYDYQNERGALRILDTRGLQEGSRPEGAEDKVDALEAMLLAVKREPPDVVLFLAKASEVDAAIDEDIRAFDRILAEIERVHKTKPASVGVLTHCDVVEPKVTRLHRAEAEPREDVDEKLVHIAQAERHLETKLRALPRIAERLDSVVGISSYLSFRADKSIRSDERWNIDRLSGTLFKHIPDSGRGLFVRVAQVKGLQDELAVDVTRLTAGACAAIAVVPIPVADVIPITALQVGLVGVIAWLGGRDLTTEAAAEFLGALGVNIGAGFAFREGARALIKFVFPGAGSAISGAVAFTGTMAIGRAAQAYFLRGESLESAKDAMNNVPADEAAEAPATAPRADAGNP